MGLKEILSLLGISLPGGLLITLSLIEALSKKHKPWSALMRWVGARLNAEVIEHQKQQGEDIAALSRKVDAQERRSEDIVFEDARYRILRFADEIRQGVRHSEEHYDQIIEDIDSYESYCSSHKDFRNGKGRAAMALIRSNYARRLEKNDFLRGDGE